MILSFVFQPKLQFKYTSCEEEGFHTTCLAMFFFSYPA